MNKFDLIPNNVPHLVLTMTLEKIPIKIIEEYIENSKKYFIMEEHLVSNLLVLAIEQRHYHIIVMLLPYININGYYDHPNPKNTVCAYDHYYMRFNKQFTGKCKLVNYLIFNDIAYINDTLCRSGSLKGISFDIITLFLKSGLDPNTILLDNYSLLQYACTTNNIPLFKLLLESGANPNLITSIGSLIDCLPKNLAGFDNIIDLILSINNLKISLSPNIFKTCAFYEKIVDYYSKYNNDKITFSDNSTILHHIVIKSSYNYIKKYIDDANIQNNYGQTPLHLLLHLKEIPIDKFDLLYNNKDILDNENNTYLMYYMKYNRYIDINIVKKLTHNINHKNIKGDTLLKYIKDDTNVSYKILEHLLYQGLKCDNDNIEFHKDKPNIYALLNNIVDIEDNNMPNIINNSHALFFLQQIRLMEEELDGISTKQYYVISKNYPTYHKYWKSCSVYYTYSTIVNYLILLRNYIYQNENYKDLNTIIKYIDDNNVIWDTFKKMAQNNNVMVVLNEKRNIVSTSSLSVILHQTDTLMENFSIVSIEPYLKRQRDF